MNRVFQPSALIAAAAALMLSFSAGAAEFEWKFYTYFAANDKPTELHRAFAEDVYKASKERLHIKVFSAGELPYKASDVLRAVATDQVQIGDVALGYVAGDVPALNVFSMPFICTSNDQFYDKAVPAMDADINATLQGKFKTRSIMQFAMPQQQLWLVKPISGIDGLKNLKIRAWNREQTDMMKLLGGSGVTITAAEVIPALQRGVVDGAFTAAVPALDWKFYEVTKMGYMMNLAPGHNLIGVNEKSLAKLPEDLKKVLLDKANEWGPKYRKAMDDAVAHATKTLAEKGMTLVSPSPEDMDKLRAVTHPMWSEWAEKNGALAKKMLGIATSACQ